MRQVILDTETTGLSTSMGHRITEVGCLELINRRITGNTFQRYINPERDIDPGAQHITGLTNEFLKDKPKFVEVVDDLLEFVKGAELIIHNAPFDIGFIDYELSLMKHPVNSITRVVTVLDTLVLARSLYPGQRNSLDALCKRLGVDNSNRKYHGALLDSEILARVYLAMTRGQSSLELGADSSSAKEGTEETNLKFQRENNYRIRVIKATEDELLEHAKYLELVEN